MNVIVVCFYKILNKSQYFLIEIKHEIQKGMELKIKSPPLSQLLSSGGITVNNLVYILRHALYQ